MKISIAKIKKQVPWWCKIGAKITLSRLPAGYDLWQQLGLFRHGYMDEASYALNVFDSHVKRVGLQGQLGDKTILEFGPGDSVATAIIAFCYGARAILVDVGRFVKNQPADYSGLIQALKTNGLRPPDIRHCKSLEDLLTTCGARYLTNGLESLAEIEDHYVDFIFSQAVLEHVRRFEFLAIQNECARVLCADGICSHRVDLRDHLGGGLNNLRFSERLWESDFFTRSGFYTNRIQFRGMVELFERAGFKAEVSGVRR
nr:methyltransferase domain-containing protein [Halothiobacillus sp.]